RDLLKVASRGSPPTLTHRDKLCGVDSNRLPPVIVGNSEVILGPDLPREKLPTPDKSGNRTIPVLGLHFSGLRVNQDPAHEIAGLEYLFANKKHFGGDDNARQKLGSVLV